MSWTSKLPEPVTAHDLVRQTRAVADQMAKDASVIDRDQAFPDTEFAALRRVGLLSAVLPTRLGGRSLGMTPNDPSSQGTTLILLQVLEEIGRGNLAVGRLFEGHVNALLLIRQYATPEQLIRWAADVHAGHLFGVWNTEGQDGLQLSAPDQSGRLTLRGAKTFASGAGHIGRPIVTGRSPNEGWQMLVVPMDQVDARVDRSWWHPLGMKASASHRVSFDQVEVAATPSLLGPPGAYYREPSFSSGAIRFAAVQLGGARALLEATVVTLQQFGRTDDPYQRVRVGSMAIAVESGRQWLVAAAEAADGVRDEADRAAIAHSMTHARMTRTAIEAIGQEVIRLAEQCVGARGLVHPHPVERIGRDLTMYLRQPGPDAALADVGRAWLEPLS